MCYLHTYTHKHAHMHRHAHTHTHKHTHTHTVWCSIQADTAYSLTSSILNAVSPGKTFPRRTAKWPLCSQLHLHVFGQQMLLYRQTYRILFVELCGGLFDMNTENNHQQSCRPVDFCNFSIPLTCKLSSYSFPCPVKTGSLPYSNIDHY